MAPKAATRLAITRRAEIDSPVRSATLASLR